MHRNPRDKEKSLITKLNSRLSFTQFKSCNTNPLKISLIPKENETATATNKDGVALKKMGSQMGGGNTLLAWLLLSSIETSTEVLMGKITVNIEVNGKKSSHEFETEYFPLREVKTKNNPKGKHDLEEILIYKIVSELSSNIKRAGRKRIPKY